MELKNKKVKTLQVLNNETVNVLNPGFLLTDVIISNNSDGKATLLVTDNVRTHIICVVNAGGVFNHNFMEGWSFWKNAKLFIVKESDLGEVNVSIGFVKINTSPDYSTWRN